MVMHRICNPSKSYDSWHIKCMQTCTSCKLQKPQEEFSLKREKRNTQCRQCVSVRYKAWYQENKAKESRRAIANTKRIKAENQLKMIRYLLEHPCVMCGEDDPIVLQFQPRFVAHRYTIDGIVYFSSLFSKRTLL